MTCTNGKGVRQARGWSRIFAALASSMLCGGAFIASGATNGSAPPQALTPFQAQMKGRGALFRGQVLISPQVSEKEVVGVSLTTNGDWPLRYQDKAAADLTISNGVLRFRLLSEETTLGWGNCDGSATGQFHTVNWRGGAFLKIRARQEKPAAKPWKAQFRYAGDARNAGQMIGFDHRGLYQSEADFACNRDWKMLEQRFHKVAAADGMALRVTGASNSWVEIALIGVVKRDMAIWARGRVVLPDEPVFAALASVSAQQDVWVNGQVVFARRPGLYSGWYNFMTLDLKPYLRPGTNVIAITDPMDMPKTPSCWMQVAVVLASGRVIPFQTDRSWKTWPREEKGWMQPAFDDSAWLPPGTNDPTGFLKAPECRIDPLAQAIFNNHYLPARECAVELRHPEGRRFYYPDSAPVRMIARAAAGDASSPRGLHWRVWDERTGKIVRERDAPFGKPDGISRQAELDLGRLEAGVYCCDVQGVGVSNAAWSLVEPFVVAGKIPMRETDDPAWDAGCKLTLVDKIDCTSTNDPRPFQDAGLLNPAQASRVVERGGLKYRESSLTSDEWNTASWFAYRIKFRNLNRPHWVVVWYPDDADRMLECQIQPYFEMPMGQKVPLVSMASFGVKTGGSYPNTHRLQPMRTLVWSQQLEPILLITKSSHRAPGTAAAARIEVYEIDELPALKTTPRGREFGMLSERATVVAQSHGRFLSHVRSRYDNKAGFVFPEEPLPAHYKLNPYIGWFEAAENYARYCRFTGQNVYFQGSYQYDVGMAWSMPPPIVPDSSLFPDIKDVMINVLDANGIGVYGIIEYYLDHRYRLIDEGLPALHEARAGADLAFQIGTNGAIMRTYAPPDNPVASPLARTVFVDTVAAVAAHYAPYPGFKGIMLLACPQWDNPAFISEATSFDDGSIRAFEKETLVHVPVADAGLERFARRYDWIMTHAKDAWMEWRSRGLRDTHAAVAERLRSIRADLDYAVVLELYDGLMDVYWSPKYSAHDLMKSRGYDPLVYRDIKSFSFGRDVWSFDPPETHALYRSTAHWQYLRDPEFLRLHAAGHGRSRVCLVRTGFDEWGAEPWLGKSRPELWAYAHMIGYVFPAHAYAAHRFATVLADSDVDLMSYGIADCHAPLGSDDALRRFAGELVSLPRTEFTALHGAGLDMNVCIREGRTNGEYFLYIVNTAWWPCDLALTVSGDGTIRRTRTDETVQAPGNALRSAWHAMKRLGSRAKPDKVLRLRLEPYDVIGLYGAETALKPVAAETVVPEEARAYVKAMIARLQKAGGRPKAKEQAEAAVARGDYMEAWRITSNDRMFWKACALPGAKD